MEESREIIEKRKKKRRRIREKIERRKERRRVRGKKRNEKRREKRGKIEEKKICKRQKRDSWTERETMR